MAFVSRIFLFEYYSFEKKIELLIRNIQRSRVMSPTVPIIYYRYAHNMFIWQIINAL